MRRHCHRAQLFDEVFRVVGLVGTERVRARPVGARFDHGERRYPLGVAVSRRQTSINQKAMAVLHQAMDDEAELGFLAWSLAVEPCIGIVVETCVSFHRFFPWKSDSVLRPPLAGGSFRAVALWRLRSRHVQEGH